VKQIRWIWRFWQPHLAWLWLLAVMTLLSAGVTLAFPLVFKYIIDQLSSGAVEDASQLSRIIWMLAIVGLVRSLANLYPAARAVVNSKLEMDVREFYFGQVIGKSQRFFQRLRTGDLVTRLTDDIGGFPKIAWFSCSGVFRAVESAAKFIFCISFMLWLNWKLALISTIPLPLMLLLFYKVRGALSKRSLERQQAISSTTDALEAAFSGIRILKAFNGERGQAAAFRKVLDDRIGVELNVTRLWVGMRNLYEGVQHAGHILVIIAGGLFLIRGEITIGDFYAFYVYQTLLLQPLLDIPNLFVTARQAFVCIDREIEIEELEAESARKYAETPASGTSIRSVELRDVTFCYHPGLPNAVEDVSLTIRAGEKAAIVGAVGSGKSTLLKLVAGILRPTKGSVLINGELLSTENERGIRPRMGYIPQESNLFSESVAENVSFGRDLPRDEISDALNMAQVLAEMERLPSGIDQVLGQRGLTVSGGQKQRLAIARALAGRPDVLLMDDVTASLDAENEQRFWDMLAASQPGVMCLIVTHRLATARKADVIYMLEGGRIVGQGTHAELVQSCEPYRQFLSREELAEELQLVAG
jgi:ATP-binding cassette subfamily B protein